MNAIHPKSPFAETGSLGQRVGMGTITEEQAASGSLGGFTAKTDVGACLLPLLQAQGWRGNPRQIVESLPYFTDSLDLTDLLNVMANMGYGSRSLRLSVREIDERLMPCLFLPDDGMAMVLVARTDQGVRVFDTQTRSYKVYANAKISGRAYVFQEQEQDNALIQVKSDSFVGDVTDRFIPVVWQTLAASLFSNLLVLATPLFIMTVYDKVISSGSMETLTLMLIGVVTALIADQALRFMRSRMIAFVGARLSYIIGRAIFQRLLFLQPAYTELANIGTQVARLKDFEGIREFFTGPLATIALETPFTLIFIVVMGFLGGNIVLVPLLTIVVFIGLGYLMVPRLRMKVAAASRAESERQAFLVEALSKMRALRTAGAEDVFGERYRELSARASMRAFESAKMSNLAASTASALIMASGVITIGWGVEKVLLGDMTVGGMIAVMILVWWVLRPLATTFTTLTQAEQVRASIRQINGLMSIKPERDPMASPPPPPPLKGQIEFDRVSLRYTNDSDPALVGVNLNVKPGEIVALVGPNGSGKTSALKMVTGMYLPQAGNVKLDGTDLRQIDPLELRRQVGYVPHECQLFFGTIAQNMRLTSPTASDAELEEAAQLAGLVDDLEAFPDGLQTKVGDGRTDKLPANISQRISLARAYLKRPSVMLLDEPANGLDFEADQQFIKTLDQLRGRTTVLLVTHRPSHLKVADTIVVMNRGQVVMAGPAEELRGKIPPEFF